MIYGKYGSGKTALIDTLAVAVATGSVPSILAGKRVISLDAQKILFDLNLKVFTIGDLHQVLSKIDGQSIIFIDNFEDLFTYSSIPESIPYFISLSELLRCFLEHPGTHWIGAANNVIKQFAEKNPYIKFYFSEFEIDETSRQESFPIVKNYAEKFLGPIFKVSYDPEIFLDLIDLCQRFVPNARFPETPIEILTQCGILVRDQKEFGPLKIQDQKEDLIQLKQQLDVEEENSSKKRTQRIEKLKEKIALKEKEIKTLGETLDLEQSLIERKKEIKAILAFFFHLIDHVEEGLVKEKLSAQIKKFETEEAFIQKELATLPARVFSESVDKNVVEKVISQKSGVAINKLTTNEKGRLKELEGKLQHRVKGQEEAIKSVTDTIQRSRLGLNGENRPRGSFLFLGPTGVGKTETCQSYCRGAFRK